MPRKNLYLVECSPEESLRRAEEIDRMAMEILSKPEEPLTPADKAARTIKALEDIVGEKLNIVVVPGGEGIPQISMVRPYAKPWFTPEQVELWNKSMKRPASEGSYDKIPMRRLVRPNPPTIDVKAEVTRLPERSSGAGGT